MVGYFIEIQNKKKLHIPKVCTGTGSCSDFLNASFKYCSDGQQGLYSDFKWYTIGLAKSVLMTSSGAKLSKP